MSPRIGDSRRNGYRHRPPTASCTGSPTRIWPLIACSATRAVIATLRPNRSSPCRTERPMWCRSAPPWFRLRFALRCVLDAMLHRNLPGAGERDHKPVTLTRPCARTSAAPAFMNQLVMRANQLDPCAIPDLFVERGGLDVGEQITTWPSGLPELWSTLHLGPAGGSSDRWRTPLRNPSCALRFAVRQTVFGRFTTTRQHCGAPIAPAVARFPGASASAGCASGRVRRPDRAILARDVDRDPCSVGLSGHRARLIRPPRESKSACGFG